MKKWVLPGLLAVFAQSRADVSATRPNVVVILADDMGYSDIGCFGSEIQTPNLDRLARNGLRMSQFYSAARCCPSRASLLTGLYPHSTGIGGMTGREYPEHANPEGYQRTLNDRCLTIEQVLKPAGYRTYAVGKWHVSDRMTLQGRDRKNWPLQRGFDAFYGTLAGAGSFYDPAWLMRDNTLISPFADPDFHPEGPYYYTDALNQNAVAYIRSHLREHADSPFFLYVAHTAPHWPLHALEEDVKKYEGFYDTGYNEVRKQRILRLREEGLLPPHWTVSAPVGDWASVPDKSWEACCMEVYAAMIDRMDQGIGRIIVELEQAGQLDHTLIFFLSDNGGCAEDYGRTRRPDWESSPAAAMQDTDIQTQVLPPMHTRSGAPFLHGRDTMPGPDGTYLSYDENWANVANTPFRKYKQYTHEGGIASPFIAHWPEGIKTPGRIAENTAHLIDLMATCADVAGAAYPEEYTGEKIHPMAGVSLRPVFEGQALPERTLFWEHQGAWAIRSGSWKLVAAGPQELPELYDMEADRTEMNDRSEMFPDRVRQMEEEWKRFGESNGILPWPWGMYNGVYCLRQGDRFGELMAPDLSGKNFEITITGEFPSGASGVLAAQGVPENGYVLYVDDGTVVFGVRFSENEYEELRCPVAPEITEIKAVWLDGGSVLIEAGGQSASKVFSDGKLFRDGKKGRISCGGGLPFPINSHQNPFKYNGRIERVVLRELL